MRMCAWSRSFGLGDSMGRRMSCSWPWRRGVGAAILSGGHIQSGYNGMAGEFGHVTVDPNGPMCQCGQKGCWETVASSRAAISTFNRLGRNQVRSIHELLRLKEDGDADAVHALEEQAHALGRGLRLITAALSPELILMVGDITASWDVCCPIIEKELASSMLAGDAPELRPTGDAELARLSGSAAMLMQRHVSYHRSTHERSQVAPL